MEHRNEERLLEALKKVEGGGGTKSAIRLNMGFFLLSIILAVATLAYYIVNGWPGDETEVRFFIFMLCCAWSSMFLSVLWGKRIWTKE